MSAHDHPHDDLLHRLHLQQIGSCTCLTKTPDHLYHKPNCRYRVLVEAAEVIAQPDQAEAYSDLLRELCCQLSVGGYNSEGLMPVETARAKINSGIDMLVQPWRDRAIKAEAALAARQAPDAVAVLRQIRADMEAKDVLQEWWAIADEALSPAQQEPATPEGGGHKSEYSQFANSENASLNGADTPELRALVDAYVRFFTAAEPAERGEQTWDALIAYLTEWGQAVATRNYDSGFTMGRWWGEMPVAQTTPEGELFDWMKAERIRDEDHVDEALRNFREDPTGDNATGVIQAALTVWTADVRGLAASRQDAHGLARIVAELPRYGAVWPMDAYGNHDGLQLDDEGDYLRRADVLCATDINEDKGPWTYRTELKAESFVNRYFLESDLGDYDVRLYINGNFADDAQRAAYGAMLAATLNAAYKESNVGTRNEDQDPAQPGGPHTEAAGRAGGAGTDQHHQHRSREPEAACRQPDGDSGSAGLSDGVQVREAGRADAAQRGMAVADPDHAGLPPLPDTSVLGFDREDHDILGYTDLQLRDYALSAVIQALQKLRITGRAPDGDHVLEIFAYSAANGRRQVMVSLPIPTPQVLDDKRIRDIFLANGFTIKEGLDDLKPYVYQAAYELIDATRVALIDEDGIGPIVGVASDGTNHTLEFLNAGVSPAGLTLRVRLPDLPPAEAVSLLQEVAACAAHDPQRKSATRSGRYVVLNMTSALHARLLAAAKGARYD